MKIYICWRCTSSCSFHLKPQAPKSGTCMCRGVCTCICVHMCACICNSGVQQSFINITVTVITSIFLQFWVQTEPSLAGPALGLLCRAVGSGWCWSHPGGFLSHTSGLRLRTPTLGFSWWLARNLKFLPVPPSTAFPPRVTLDELGSDLWLLLGTTGLLLHSPPANAGDSGFFLIPGLGRSPGERNGDPLQYSCLRNPMGRGAW